MGVNANLNVLLRPTASTMVLGVGMLLALLAWLRSDPEYVPARSRDDATRNVGVATDGPTTTGR